MSFAEDKSVALCPVRLAGAVAQDLEEEGGHNFHCGKGATRVSATCLRRHFNDMTAQGLGYLL